MTKHSPLPALELAGGPTPSLSGCQLGSTSAASRLAGSRLAHPLHRGQPTDVVVAHELVHIPMDVLLAPRVKGAFMDALDRPKNSRSRLCGRLRHRSGPGRAGRTCGSEARRSRRRAPTGAFGKPLAAAFLGFRTFPDNLERARTIGDFLRVDSLASGSSAFRAWRPGRSSSIRRRVRSSGGPGSLPPATGTGRSAKYAWRCHWRLVIRGTEIIHSPPSRSKSSQCPGLGLARAASQDETHCGSDPESIALWVTEA